MVTWSLKPFFSQRNKKYWIKAPNVRWPCKRSLEIVARSCRTGFGVVLIQTPKNQNGTVAKDACC